MIQRAPREHVREPVVSLAPARSTSPRGTTPTIAPPPGAHVAGSAATAVSLQQSFGNRAVAALLAPTPARPRRTNGSAQAIKVVQREPTVTLVDNNSGLSAKELKTVVSEAQRALNNTTGEARGALRKSGVKVRSQSSLQGVEALRKGGDILVYLIHDIKSDANREKVVREILTAEGALKGTRLDEIVKRVSGDLSQGEHVRDRASNVAFINLDLIAERGPDSLRAIAGDVLHEGIGHRAIPPPVGESTYHNPKNKGVMSEAIRQKATKADVLFQGEERNLVNEFLKSVADNPEWNKD